MGAVGLQTHIWNNNLRSAALLAGFPFLLVMVVSTVGYSLIGGRPGEGASFGQIFLASVPLSLVVAGVWFVIAYFANTAILDLATGAKPVSRQEAPELYNLLENLCISRGLPMPKLHVIESEGMNAFASGMNKSQYTVTVTRGLLNALTPPEIEAVLGHELTHIISRDVRTMVIASVFAGILTLIAQMLFRGLMWGGRRERRGGGAATLIAMAVAALGYLLAIVIQMALSRRREFVADAGSVELTKNPDAMISALRKISGNAHLDAPQSVRGMFLEDHEDGIMGLFATHPPIEKRIAALVRYAGGRDLPPPPAPEPQPLPTQTATTPGPWDDAQPAPGPWDAEPAPSPNPTPAAGPWG